MLNNFNEKMNKQVPDIVVRNSAMDLGSAGDVNSNCLVSPHNTVDTADGIVNAAEKLKPVLPDPRQGFQPFSHYQLNKITGKVMEHMKRICYDRNMTLDYRYWQEKTMQILGSQSTTDALIVPSPAGSGKSTWIIAFHLALIEMVCADSELDSSLVGTVVVLQKVSDLNELAAVLNAGHEDDPPVVALQGWTTSGANAGYCKNNNVTSYSDCRMSKCPYASECKILSFKQKAASAFIVGITQERFYMLRKNGELDTILYRNCTREKQLPRRYIIFDEKFRMAQTTALNKPLIDQVSTEFNKLIRMYYLRDTQVGSLQRQLAFCVERPFQEMRKELRIDKDTDPKDIPAGVVQLTDQQLSQYADDFFKLRSWITEERPNYMTRALRDIFLVMSHLCEGGSCFYTKCNGFTIFHIIPPQLCYGQCQTILFDATAEVDADYQNLNHVKVLGGAPDRENCHVQYYVYKHSDLNVSMTAMDKDWKIGAFGSLVTQIMGKCTGSVFLCTYKKLAVPLAAYLQDQLTGKEFLRIPLMPDQPVPTIPYLGGTNGSNKFNHCSNVIMIGYPRLNPETYLSYACAAYGVDTLRQELELIPEDDLVKKAHQVLLELPALKEYVPRHLAARLEQEIYRCAMRNPDFRGSIDIHLFCPPDGVFEILHERIPGDVTNITACPPCVAEQKRMLRKYETGYTSFHRLIDFIDSWEGEKINTAEIRAELHISQAVWKDLMADPQIQDKLSAEGVLRSGRGLNSTWSRPKAHCA